VLESSRNSNNVRRIDVQKVYRWIFVLLVLVIVVVFGFTFTVKEGSCVMVSRFGEIRSVHNDTGLHFKLPWPFEQTITYDTRSQYIDSGYTETLTSDKKNVILQTYAVWHIEDAKKYHMSIGSASVARDYLNDLVANAKNGVLGSYALSDIVSTQNEIKIDEVSSKIEEQITAKALENYGIAIESVRIKRVALPDNNVQSVLEQMIADRQKYANELIAEGEKEAAIITSEANSEAANIIANGTLEAAQINAQTERSVAEIYAEAYDRNTELFIFLKKLIALENSVSESTVLVLEAQDSPFDVLGDLEHGVQQTILEYTGSSNNESENGDDAGGGDGE